MASNPKDLRKENEELLSQLFNRTLRKMLKQVEDGEELDPRQVANAIKLFKDNGINIEVKRGGEPNLPPDDLPFHGEYLMTNDEGSEDVN